MESIKTRYKNMESAYKKFKTELKDVPTGGGKLSKQPKFIELLDLHLSQDIRVTGIKDALEADKKNLLKYYR